MKTWTNKVGKVVLALMLGGCSVEQSEETDTSLHDEQSGLVDLSSPTGPVDPVIFGEEDNEPAYTNLLSVNSVTATTTDALRQFYVGAGLYDVTGRSGDSVFSGMGDIGQVATGIRQRLYSRAFVVANKAQSNRVAVVTVDMGHMHNAVRSAVLDKLASTYGSSKYTDENVMIMATHTHSGPGGYSKEPLYDMYTWGFQKQNFDALVDGIYQSIVTAHNNLQLAQVRTAAGDVTDYVTDDADAGTKLNANRSEVAYKANPMFERYEFGPMMTMKELPHTNTRMTLLRFDGANCTSCTEIGSLNFFSVHPTSFGPSNTRTSGDNKGMAAYLFERDMGDTYAFSGSHASKEFVAAFANSDEGDASPSVCNVDSADGCGDSESDSAWFSANRQYEVALSLYSQARSASAMISGVDYRHAYVDFSNVTIADEWNPRGYVNGAGQKKTCTAAIGFSFAAGAEDGRTSFYPDIHEGMKEGDADVEDMASTLMGLSTTVDDLEDLSSPSASQLLSAAVSALVDGGLNAVMDSADDPCQSPKAIFLPTGDLNWTPKTLPVQIIRVGRVAIVGVPAEFTTAAGRRLRTTVANELGTLVDEVVIGGLANAYAGYVTTPEEYDSQQYEGASTHFGRLTLLAFQQTAAKLARDMKNGTNTFPKGTRPADKCSSSSCVTVELPYSAFGAFEASSYFDDKPLGTSFGDVITGPSSSYSDSDSVEVSFRAGHPGTNLRQQNSNSYATIQKKDSSGNWVDVFEDTHPSVALYWDRGGITCANCMTATVKWNIPSGTSGTFRIYHRGSWKSGWDGSVSSYSGVTSSFTVR